MAYPLSNLSFQTLFNAASDAMLLVDESGHVAQANAALQNLLGYSAEEIMGLSVEALMPERYRHHHVHHRSHFANNPEKRPMGSGPALVALTKDGNELKVDVGLSPINCGEQFFTLATFYDTDRRRRAEELLKISEERLRLAKEAAGLGIFDYTSTDKLLVLDERTKELWGTEPDQPITYERFLSSIHPEDRVTRQVALDHAMDPLGNGEYKTQYRVLTPSNGLEHWISVTGKAYFKDGRFTRLIGVAKDITEQKIFEKKLHQHHAETEAVFMQQVATQTASAIAHELNQPLAAISAYSEVALHELENKTVNQENLKRALEGCVKQAQRAGSSLHELMAFLQKGDLVRDPLDLNNIVQEALKIAKTNGYGSFHPMLNLEKNMPYVLGNKTQIMKILVNLIRNSVEAMHSAGMPISAITITVKTNTDINMAHVTMRDSGPGLDKETAQRIFEPFFTTKPTGIGMGLAISRALAEANGGQLWLDPDSNSGAVFHFTLPFAQ